MLQGWSVVMPDLFRGNPAMQPSSFFPDFLAALPMIYRLKYRHGKDTVLDRDVSK
jgi:hypothetical protein